MKKEVIFLIVAVLVISAIVFFVPQAGRVSTADRTPEKEYAAEAMITVKLGEEGKILGVSVAPLEVLEDSRCPEDVVCIQEGTVRLRVRIKSALGESVMVMTLRGAITTEAEQVVFSRVLPPPRSEIGMRANEYRFEFRISKRHGIEI